MQGYLGAPPAGSAKPSRATRSPLGAADPSTDGPVYNAVTGKPIYVATSGKPAMSCACCAPPIPPGCSDCKASSVTVTFSGIAVCNAGTCIKGYYYQPIFIEPPTGPGFFTYIPYPISAKTTGDPNGTYTLQQLPGSECSYHGEFTGRGVATATYWGHDCDPNATGPTDPVTGLPQPAPGPPQPPIAVIDASRSRQPAGWTVRANFNFSGTTIGQPCCVPSDRIENTPGNRAPGICSLPNHPPPNDTPATPPDAGGVAFLSMPGYTGGQCACNGCCYWLLARLSIAGITTFEVLLGQGENCSWAGSALTVEGCIGPHGASLLRVWDAKLTKSPGGWQLTVTSDGTFGDGQSFPDPASFTYVAPTSACPPSGGWSAAGPLSGNPTLTLECKSVTCPNCTVCCDTYTIQHPLLGANPRTVSRRSACEWSDGNGLKLRCEPGSNLGGWPIATWRIEWRGNTTPDSQPPGAMWCAFPDKDGCPPTDGLPWRPQCLFFAAYDCSDPPSGYAGPILVSKGGGCGPKCPTDCSACCTHYTVTFSGSCAAATTPYTTTFDRLTSCGWASAEGWQLICDAGKWKITANLGAGTYHFEADAASNPCPPTDPSKWTRVGNCDSAADINIASISCQCPSDCTSCPDTLALTIVGGSKAGTYPIHRDGTPGICNYVADATAGDPIDIQLSCHGAFSDPGGTTPTQDQWQIAIGKIPTDGLVHTTAHAASAGGCMTGLTWVIDSDDSGATSISVS